MHATTALTTATRTAAPAAHQAAIADADLVLHTAGPFQHSSNYNVIEAALEARTPYIDVCDDTTYSEGWVGHRQQQQQRHVHGGCGRECGAGWPSRGRRVAVARRLSVPGRRAAARIDAEQR